MTRQELEERFVDAYEIVCMAKIMQITRDDDFGGARMDGGDKE